MHRVHAQHGVTDPQVQVLMEQQRQYLALAMTSSSGAREPFGPPTACDSDCDCDFEEGTEYRQGHDEDDGAHLNKDDGKVPKPG